MGKKKMDFDFSDISGSKVIKEPKPKKETVEKEEVKKSGILLTIPVEGTDNWLSRDLTDCSPEEFMLWVQHVYPFHDNDLKAEHFQEVITRKRAVREITQFHSSKIFSRTPDEQLKH